MRNEATETEAVVASCSRDGEARDVVDELETKASGSGAASDASGSLDFLSEKFDAAKALAARPALLPPDPDAPLLDNVSKCRALLPPEMEESLVGVVHKPGSLETKLKSEQLKGKALRMLDNVKNSCNMSLEEVHGKVKQGQPLDLLRQWHNAGTRVRVVTRHAAGVRGVATGQLVSYDRFANLVLRDVFEQYCVRVKVQRVKKVLRPKPLEPGESASELPEMEEVEKIRWVHKQEHRERHLGLIFVKGDNLVLVSSAAQYEKKQDSKDVETRGQQDELQKEQ